MRYQGKAIEVIGEKNVFGQRIAWIHQLEDDVFRQVVWDDLEEEPEDTGISPIRYIALAARIKEEIAQKRLLAPYESSLLPLPHQLLILEKLMKAPQTRFLLADEVGMGKTIEAGLAIKELKLRGEIRRTLLIVPKSAMIQWQSEMQEHFKEQFHIYDSQLISSLSQMFSRIDAEEELNFWRQHNQIIVSTDALKPLEHRQGWSQEKIDEYNKYRIEAVVNADFDLVIIDEAHKMGGSTSQVSRYQLAETLSNAVPRLLLLSATPHRGKSDHFRRVLRLLDADAFEGEGMPEIKEIEPYVLRSEKRNAVDYNGEPLFRERTTTKMLVPMDEERHRLQLALYDHLTNYVRTAFNKAKRTHNPAIALVMTLFQKIASSSTAAIMSALGTRLYRLQNGLDDELSNYLDDGGEDEDTLNPESFTIEQNADGRTEEEILSGLVEEARQCLATETDAKATALISAINKVRMDEGEPSLKVLVFTEFRATQEYLVSLLTQMGLRCQHIHGGMNLEQRNLALRRFRDEADVMVSTDAAGESLNMQFCHVIFNYDLPWNPMAIEQRIGRVDRIGQTHNVRAFNMLTDNSIDARVYSIIVEKLDVILEELGIDKTSDVLDSTIDTDRINHVYLQSLLDPKRAEYVGENWLKDIKQKLREYKSTEGLLPTVPKEEISNKEASGVKYSPLPVWLEQLMDLHCMKLGGTIQKNVLGETVYRFQGGSIKAVFTADAALNVPDAEHITLQHERVKRILDSIDTDVANSSYPVMRAAESVGTNGWFTIWKVSADSQTEHKETFVAQFQADNGKLYAAYANQIWNKLVEEQNAFERCGTTDEDCDNEPLQEFLYGVFHRMENEIRKNIGRRNEARKKSLDYQQQRAERIGIPNIRIARLKRLQEEREQWEHDLVGSQRIVPSVKNILKVRVYG